MKKIFSLLALMSFGFGTMSKIIATSSLVDQQREPLIIEEQSNLDLYYKNNDNKGDIVFNDWGLKKDGWRLWHTFNIHLINPINYKYIMFLGQESDFFSKISWGNIEYYGDKLNKYNNFHSDNETCKKMINANIVDVKDIPKLIKPENRFLVQARWVKYGNAYLEGSQWFALTWYYENNSYYIQVLTQHWVNVTGSSIGGGTWMGIGTGIRLYND